MVDYWGQEVKGHTMPELDFDQIKSNLIVSVACVARLHSSDD